MLLWFLWKKSTRFFLFRLNHLFSMWEIKEHMLRWTFYILFICAIFFHIYKIKVLNSISIYDHLFKYDGIFNTIKAVNIYARFIYKMNVKKSYNFFRDSHWETWPGWLLSNQNCTCECESVCFIRWCWKDWRSDTYKNSIAIHMTICLHIHTKTDRNLSTPPIKCLNGECFSLSERCS